MPADVAHCLRVFEYDPLHHRVWIFGQRCHHGATGLLVAAIACRGLLHSPRPSAGRVARKPSILALAAGGVLMLHDWKDRSMWFKREHMLRP